MSTNNQAWRITCPNNPTHTRFEVDALVSELWEVDEWGDFCRNARTSDKVDIFQRPGSQDFYACVECGAPATVVINMGQS